MHTVRLKLKVTREDERILEKRFRAMWHIHNVLVKHAISLLNRLKYDTSYQALRQEYSTLLALKAPAKKDEARKKELSKSMNECRKAMGLSSAGLQSYVKVCGKQFSKYVSSQQVQKEASRVWAGVEKVLFGKGKKLHYKKRNEFYTISGKSNKNGVKFNKENLSLEWLGLFLSCKRSKKQKDIAYLMESLSHDISYCEIERKMFTDGWHYYVIVYLKGDAPKKARKIGTGVTGIDRGTSTLASVSDENVLLQELAPDCAIYNKQIGRRLKLMDVSRKNSNPGKYNADGTINTSNKDKWIYSKGYFRKLRQLKTLYRRKSAYIKQSHLETIYELLKDSVDFITEEMNFKGFQKRSKKTERSEKVSTVKAKDGTTKEVRKFKKKKRFGKSISDRSPALFLKLLEQVCRRYGGDVYLVDTKTFRASQYDHVSDTCNKVTLADRFKTIDGKTVQRDLYSAFLLKNTDGSLQKADRDKCMAEFGYFLTLHDKRIDLMKRLHFSRKCCFGF